jgi:hypothetical protein
MEERNEEFNEIISDIWKQLESQSLSLIEEQ